MKCAKCGTERKIGKFCPECGSNEIVDESKAETHDIKCAKCGHVRKRGKFCPECGSNEIYVEPQVMVCSDCGTVRKSGKFCSECGSTNITYAPASKYADKGINEPLYIPGADKSAEKTTVNNSVQKSVEVPADDIVVQRTAEVPAADMVAESSTPSDIIITDNLQSNEDVFAPANIYPDDISDLTSNNNINDTRSSNPEETTEILNDNDDDFELFFDDIKETKTPADKNKSPENNGFIPQELPEKLKRPVISEPAEKTTEQNTVRADNETQYARNDQTAANNQFMKNDQSAANNQFMKNNQSAANNQFMKTDQPAANNQFMKNAQSAANNQFMKNDQQIGDKQQTNADQSYSAIYDTRSAQQGQNYNTWNNTGYGYTQQQTAYSHGQSYMTVTPAPRKPKAPSESPTAENMKKCKIALFILAALEFFAMFLPATSVGTGRYRETVSLSDAHSIVIFIGLVIIAILCILTGFSHYLGAAIGLLIQSLILSIASFLIVALINETGEIVTKRIAYYLFLIVPIIVIIISIITLVNSIRLKNEATLKNR